MPTTTALYRKSSGEVLRVVRARPDGSINMFDVAAQANPALGVAIDPLTPDGDKVRDDSGIISGPMRILGLAKHYDLATNTVRNSVQAEIDTYQTNEDDDEANDDAKQAQDLLKTHPLWRKMFGLVIKMVNQTRRDAGLTPWTKTEILNFITTQITKND